MTPQREQAEHLLAAGQRDQAAVRILRKDPESPVEITLFHAQQVGSRDAEGNLSSLNRPLCD